MSRIVWDQAGSRLYETGLDRGVLYLSDKSGVPWNGLTGVDENFSDDSTDPQYFDGVKYLDLPSIGNFVAKLSAFTYPDEFMEYEGSLDLGNGLSIDDQAPKSFGLSYRTIVGNDTEGDGYGYKIHVLYNLLAVPDNKTHSSLNDKPSPLEFSWTLNSIPAEVTNYRPTAHVIVDTRLLPEPIVQDIENVLYGDVNTDPRLPTIDELIDIAVNWDPRIINPDSTTGLSMLTAGVGDITITKVAGVYTALPSTRLVETDIEGFYQLTP